MPRFDVYGRFTVVVEPDGGGGWRALREGADGKRAPLPDVPFPADLPEGGLQAHLEDVFHEHGAPGRELRLLPDAEGGGAPGQADARSSPT